ncbi:MAG: alpha/beta fold hydrolase [Myxococcales bacterium]|nr:alpha/beta fold hydrolase [Myxococcales bacterium]
MPAVEAGRSWHPAGRYHALRSFAGQRVHVVSVGEGPHVALLHGFIQSSWAWRHNVDALARHFTVHAICLPGFGWSDKPGRASYRLLHQAERVLELLDVLGADTVQLVGNSLGAALALEVALLAPHRVGRLVLVNPAGAGIYPIALVARLQHEALEPVLRLPGVPRILALGLRHGAYARLDVDAAFLRAFLSPLYSPGGVRTALKSARAFHADLAALDRRLPDIPNPAFVAWGQGDRIVPRAVIERVVARLPDARLEPFDCSGHCPMEEEPDRFNRETVAFLHATGRARVQP